MASLTGNPEPTISTLRFGSGGHAFLAGFPLEDLWAGREWLRRQSGETALFPVVVEESGCFLDDYDNPAGGTVGEILAAASEWQVESVVDLFRQRGKDLLEHWRRQDLHRDYQIGPDDKGFWRGDEGMSEWQLVAMPFS